MRILNDESDKKIDGVSIYLTKDEALQFHSYLSQLLEDPNLQHVHVSSADYKKEITLCVYDKNNLTSFDARSIRLINEDA